jgi:hypothetical protein
MSAASSTVNFTLDSILVHSLKLLETTVHHNGKNQCGKTPDLKDVAKVDRIQRIQVQTLHSVQQ